jgi:hypothetical protein
MSQSIADDVGKGVQIARRAWRGAGDLKKVAAMAAFGQMIKTGAAVAVGGLSADFYGNKDDAKYKTFFVCGDEAVVIPTSSLYTLEDDYKSILT